MLISVPLTISPWSKPAITMAILIGLWTLLTSRSGFGIGPVYLLFILMLPRSFMDRFLAENFKLATNRCLRRYFVLLSYLQSCFLLKNFQIQPPSPRNHVDLP